MSRIRIRLHGRRFFWLTNRYEAVATMSAQLAEEVLRSLPESTPATSGRSMAVPVVVIGTGPVGIRVAQEILARDPHCPLVLFGDEPWQPYNRVQLSSLLAGELSWGALQNPLHTDTGSRVLQHHNCAVVSIDRERREIVDRQGRRHRYGTLILAVGSRPHIPSIPGISQSGVFRFRDMSDMQALAARKARSRATVILGGGLLGLEAARGLAKAGTRVTVVEHAPRIMPAQLDDEASARLKQQFETLGISILLGHSVQKVIGDGHITGVRLRDGSTLECDTLVVATGIRPNIDLARGCGLRVNRGIVIDDHCATSDPSIFAIGECTEHQGRIHGLVGPGLEQAAVLAHHLNGQTSAYHGSLSATRLKVVRRAVFSMGVVDEAEEPLWFKARFYRDEDNAVYRKLILRRNRLVGVIALGDWDELNRVQESVHSGRVLLPWQLRRFEREGRLWPAADALSVLDWPATAVVCNCTGVTHGALSTAVHSGCTRVEQLSQATGAGSVCGGCKPLLAQLAGAKSVPQELTGIRALALVSLLALPVLLGMGLPADLLIADSVQSLSYRIARLWQDSLWKQVSGFTLLGLGVIGLGLTLRKRSKHVTWGNYGHWRMLHGALGAAALAVLLLHTGLQAGAGLNAWLLLNFLALALAGALAGMGTAYAAFAMSRSGRQLQRWLSHAHLYIAWPLPVLLGFHVLSVYYF